MQELLDLLVKNQLWAAGLLSTFVTTWMVRKGLFPTDKARVIAFGVVVFASITLIRLAGGEPAADLVSALPEAIGAILTAFGIALPVTAGGALAFRVARTQPGSE